MKYIAGILFVLILCTASAGETPVWPLKIGISQSSSFAEFRGMRLHAGIDLRTKRRTGFPIIAIADGFISRASVQYRGYGYALYVDHPELKARVVYGHLQDFQGPLKKYIDAKLARKGSRHGINDFFEADRFPVKKGQVLALSGETGSGPPHLHFEIRNFADEPLAPALFGYRPADKIIPSFHHFYIEPLSFACVIDGSFLPRQYKLAKKSMVLYKLAPVPTVDGNIGLQAGISDTNGEGNRYGVENITLEINGNKALERVFHRYSYAQSRQATWVYDYFKSNQKGTGYVYTLFKWPFDTLYFSSGYPAWSGAFNPMQVERGCAEFVINAEDYGGNSIKAVGTIVGQAVDFSGDFAISDLADFRFAGVAQTEHSLVAVASRSKGKKTVEKAGMVTCRDGSGSSARLKALLKGSSLEIAFPKDRRWQDGAWLGEAKVLDKSVLLDSAGGRLAMEPGAEAVFARNSLHFPMFCRLAVINSEPVPGGSSKRGFLKPYSSVWQLSPSDKVFDAEVKVLLRPHDYSGNLKKLGVYNVSDSGSYSHNGEKVEQGLLTFSTRAGGKYVILEDRVAPVLRYLRKGSDYRLGRVYVFKASDLGEGVDYLSATATVAGKKVEVYSDPDKAEIYVVRSGGSNSKVQIKVSDYAGNSGSLTRTIK